MKYQNDLKDHHRKCDLIRQIKNLVTSRKAFFVSGIPLIKFKFSLSQRTDPVGSGNMFFRPAEAEFCADMGNHFPFSSHSCHGWELIADEGARVILPHAIRAIVFLYILSDRFEMLYVYFLKLLKQVGADNFCLDHRVVSQPMCAGNVL